MKKLKKVLIALVLGITILAGIKVNALTRNDEKNIAQHIWDAWYNFQLDLNDSSGIASYVGYECVDRQYLIPNQDAPIYKVPKEVYEGYISSHFVVDESWFEKFRVDFNSGITNGDPWWGYLIDPQYIEEGGQYYYKYELVVGAGGITYSEVKGYKDLGNKYYQFYLHGEYGTEAGPKYIYATYKIHYNNNIVKFISAEELDENSFPRDDEMILYEPYSLMVLEGANQEFDVSKDENLTFEIDAKFGWFDKVYINDEEVDSSNYTMTADNTMRDGNTTITFKNEYTDNLKNDKYNLKVTFKDGRSIETTFTIVGNDKIIVLEGANQKFDASKDKNLTFRIDAEFNLFDKVYINNKEVDSKNYIASEGSTVITFNDEYTKSLKNGKHNLKVTFTDGTSTETTFTIANSVDNTSTGLYTSLGILTTLGILGCAIVFINTRKHSKFPQV